MRLRSPACSLPAFLQRPACDCPFTLYHGRTRLIRGSEKSSAYPRSHRTTPQLGMRSSRVERTMTESSVVASSLPLQRDLLARPSRGVVGTVQTECRVGCSPWQNKFFAFAGEGNAYKKRLGESILRSQGVMLVETRGGRSERELGLRE